MTKTMTETGKTIVTMLLVILGLTATAGILHGYRQHNREIEAEIEALRTCAQKAESIGGVKWETGTKAWCAIPGYEPVIVCTAYATTVECEADGRGYTFDR